MSRNWILEKHEYAPELNKIVFFNGATLNAQGITSIREARDKLFKPISKQGRWVNITAYSPFEDKRVSLASGMFTHTNQVLDIIKARKVKNSCHTDFNCSFKVLG